jgi:hypothetical protein
VVVLSNQTQATIDAVTLEWTINDAAGRTTTTYTTWEGYFNAVINGLGPQRGGVRGRGAVANSILLNRQAQLLMISRCFHSRSFIANRRLSLPGCSHQRLSAFARR